MNLLASALKGKDASMVALLKPIAEELDFGLFIANIELYKSGPGADYGDYGEDDVDFAEVYEEKLTISNIVDMDGTPMDDDDVTVDMEDMIPKSFGENEEPDEREYEGYMGNVSFEYSSA